ncbi:MAG: rhomboid family intramembrane serine protease [Planctomycetota bacterium]|nr:rhomboid family intramembrane serine protease [Planctomycetota bacterium]
MSPRKPLDLLLRWLDVPHATLFIIGAQVITYMFASAIPEDQREQSIGRLELVMSEVCKGEVWRLVTFPFIMGSDNVLFLFFALMFFYFMGTALEAQWGTAKYNLFLLTGYVAAVVGACFLPAGVASPLGILGSVFLAFAYLHPEYIIYVMFIIPVQVKWLALFTWGMYGYMMFTGPGMVRLMVAASVANFLLFFGRDMLGRTKRSVHVASQQGKIAKEAETPFHTCVVCGVNDKSDRQMEFRYCPKCKGSPCYCANHIGAHEHVV